MSELEDSINELEENNSTDPSEQGSTDPFAPENIGVVQVIMQMRIYDVLMALLTDASPNAAKRLLELHKEGSIFGSTPSLNGNFITDMMEDD